jgi:6-pyruvoyltetrahydropterin/6-carboxytetrahydropterin synthase
VIVTRIEKLRGILNAPAGRPRIFVFDVEVSVEGPIDSKSGMVVNLTSLKARTRERVVQPWDGHFLDGLDGRPLARTPEELARLVWKEMEGAMSDATLARVRIGSPGEIIAACRGGEDSPMDVTRIYDFSASHRLHSPGLSDEENRKIFGKCNNPHGHGHNYVLEVTLQGRAGDSGELAPWETVDSVVREHVVDRWDHKNLNEDLSEFQGINPTAEGIVRLAWQRLAKALDGKLPQGVRLYRLKLLETPRNHVEYFGD